jgi:hypothetical protein
VIAQVFSGELTPSSSRVIAPSGARCGPSGRIQTLDPEQQVDVGFTGRVVDVSKVASNPGVPVWEAMR